MTYSGFGTVHPFNCLGCPLFFILVDICPFCLLLGCLFRFQTCGQVNSVFLLEFFVRVVLGWGRWRSCLIISMRQSVILGGTDVGSCSTQSYHSECLCRRLGEAEERRAIRCYRFSQSDGASHSVAA